MGTRVSGLVERALEIHEHDGAQALHEFGWALPPADQLAIGIEAFNRRELQLLADWFPDDFEQDMRPTELPDLGVYRGSTGYMRMMREWLDVFPDAQLEIKSFEEEGDHYYAVVAQHLSGGSSHVPVNFEYAQISLTDAGRPVRAAFYTDLAAAHAAYEALVAEASVSRR